MSTECELYSPRILVSQHLAFYGPCKTFYKSFIDGGTACPYNNRDGKRGGESLRRIRGAVPSADGAFHPLEISVDGGRIASAGRSVSSGQSLPPQRYLAIPGFVDVHVHLGTGIFL